MSKRKVSSVDEDEGSVRQTLSKIYNHITYGLEWDTLIQISLPEHKKKLIDREIIFKNGKIKFTSEGLDSKNKLYCQYVGNIKKEIEELEEKIQSSSKNELQIYKNKLKNLENKLEQAKQCNCNFTLESQLGVFTYSNEEYVKSVEEFNQSYQLFVNALNDMIETSQVNGYPLLIHNNYAGEDCSTNLDKKYKSCSLIPQEIGVNKLESNEEQIPLCSYFEILNEYSKHGLPAGRPQMTVGIALKYIPKIYLLYSLYCDEYNNFKFIYKASSYILKGSDVKDRISLSEEDYLTLLGFTVLMISYCFSFFTQGNEYFKSYFPIKLRTNPASLYESLSLKLKSAFPIILSHLKSIRDLWMSEIGEKHIKYYDEEGVEHESNKKHIDYYHEELKKFLLDKITQFSNDFFNKYIDSFGIYDLFYQKLLIIVSKKYKIMYHISKFNEDVELPEGIQDGTLYDIKGFEEKKEDYSLYFDTSENNIRLVPAINFKYNLYDTKSNTFLDEQDTSEDPTLVLDYSGFKSKKDKNKLITPLPRPPKLVFKNSRFGIWEWPQFDKDGFVHIEFRNYDGLYKCSRLIEFLIYKKLFVLDNHDYNDSGYLNFRDSTIFILDIFFREVLQDGKNNQLFIEEFVKKYIDTPDTPIIEKVNIFYQFSQIFLFFDNNITLFRLSYDQLMRIYTIISNLYQTNGNHKMSLLKDAIKSNICKNDPCEFINTFLSSESDEEIIKYVQIIINKIYRISLLFGDIFNSPINFSDENFDIFFEELTRNFSDQTLKEASLYLDSIRKVNTRDKLIFIEENPDRFKTILKGIQDTQDKRNQSILRKVPLIGQLINYFSR